MKVIFVCGPYRANSHHEFILNVRKVEAVGCQIWREGAVAICPHLNSFMFSGLCDEDVFLRGYCEVVKRCDALILFPEWIKSVGACSEKAMAEAYEKPIFELSDWDRLVLFINE